MGRTLLHLAATTNNGVAMPVKMVISVLQVRYLNNILSKFTMLHVTDLHVAIRNGHAAIFKLLLDSGIPITQVTQMIGISVGSSY